MGGAQTAPNRDIDLLDTFNLRDLGGYRTDDGRRVKWRTLFRGAALHRLAGTDLEVVRGLGLRTAIDLRTGGELTAHGAYPTDVLPARFHHLPMIDRIWDLEEAFAEATPAPERYLMARYREMLDEGAATIATAVELLSRPESLPAVVYCAAGKDRTGVLAALVLDAVGVRRSEIVDDYHLSKARVERIRARALAAGHASAMDSQPPAFMQAPAEAMALLIDWIQAEFGGSAAYLRGIGVPAPVIAALADTVTERDPFPEPQADGPPCG
jgi:protein-tyrosine phosphatase